MCSIYIIFYLIMIENNLNDYFYKKFEYDSKKKENIIQLGDTNLK